MALFSWLTAALTGCGDDEPKTPPPELRLAAPAPLGQGGTLSSALSPDGQLIAVGSTWGVALHDRADLSSRWFFPTDAAVLSVSFSADGAALVVAERGGRVGLRSAASGEETGAIQAASERPSVALSPKAERLAVGGEGVLVYALSAGAVAGEPRALGGLTGAINALAWSPDGATLAACSEAGEVGRWRGDETTASVQHEHQRQCRDLAWSPDGQHLASVGQELVVSTANGPVASWPPSKGKRMEAVTWTADGQALVSGMDQGWAQVWSPTGEPLRELKPLYSAPSSLSAGPGGLLLVQSDDATVWNTDSGERLAVLASPASALALAQAGPLLAAASRSQVSVLQGGQSIAGMTGHTHYITGLGFSGGALLSWSPRELIGWDPRSGERRFTITPDDGVTLEAVALHPSLPQATTASIHRPTTLTKELRLQNWGTQTGEALAPFVVETSRIGAADELLWSPKGDALAVRGGSAVQVYGADGAALAAMTDLLTSTGGTAWAPDGSWLVSIQRDGRPVRWDPKSGATLGELRGELPGRGAARLFVSPDGQLIAGMMRLREGDAVYVWRASGELLYAGLPEASGSAQSLAFHPQHSLLAGGFGADAKGHVVLWDLSTGAALQRVESPRSYAQAIAWTADGQALIASMDGGIMRLEAQQ